VLFRLRFIGLHLRLSVNDIKFCVETGLVSGRYKGNDDEANYSLKTAINLHTWEHTFSEQSVRSSNLNLPVMVSQKRRRQWHSYRLYTNLSMGTYKVSNCLYADKRKCGSAIMPVIFCPFSPFQNRRAGAQCNINCSASSQRRHCRRCAIAP